MTAATTRCIMPASRSFVAVSEGSHEQLGIPAGGLAVCWPSGCRLFAAWTNEMFQQPPPPIPPSQSSRRELRRTRGLHQIMQWVNGSVAVGFEAKQPSVIFGNNTYYFEAL